MSKTDEVNTLGEREWEWYKGPKSYRKLVFLNLVRSRALAKRCSFKLSLTHCVLFSSYQESANDFSILFHNKSILQLTAQRSVFFPKERLTNY